MDTGSITRPMVLPKYQRHLGDTRGKLHSPSEDPEEDIDTQLSTTAPLDNPALVSYPPTDGQGVAAVESEAGSVSLYSHRCGRDKQRNDI